jgi:hypothetical protein
MANISTADITLFYRWEKNLILKYLLHDNNASSDLNI